MKQLQGMLAFVEAATSGSLTAAATRLEVTPAAVSKSLARLESQLGVRLLNRSTRRLGLTAEGERFLGKARAALRALDEAVADVTQSALAPAGRVRVSVGMAFGRRWVLPALPALVQRYPELRVDVDLDNRPVDLVAEGYDIGIRGGVLESSSLVARRICPLPLVLVASPAYLKQAGVPRTPDALSGHRCVAVHLGSAPPTPWRFRRPGARGERLQLTPEPQVSVSDPEAVVELALGGAGIAQTGLSHVLPHLRAGRLKLLLSSWHDPGTREMVLHYPHRQYLAPRVRVVVEALLQHLRAAGDLHLTLPQVLAELPDAVVTADAEPVPARARRR